MKIGVSTYSLSRAIQSGEMSVIEAIAYIAEIGGEHVEIVPIGFNLTKNPELISEIRQKAVESGIEISNYAIGAEFSGLTEEAFELEISRVKKEVDIAAQLGIKLMRHDVASTADISIQNFNLQLPKLAEACRRVAEYAATFGITTSIENHGYFLQASDRVQALIHATDRANFRTTLDIGNFMCADENSIVAVKKNISYASMVHIKDFYLRSFAQDPGEGWFPTAHGNHLRGAIIGNGDIDMRNVLKVVKQSGFDGFLSVEFEGMEECKLGTRIGLNNLKQLWNEI
ncbi:sugar phosphate isomerase/epimerase [Paenibacillus psychroresistens]|uniref:Sugar phosphate isomerase/epimerase n=1 Tax=Paenibacillus psychroresistens TaxID=1778678 RepID=A0A6B8RR04_9BACL|nr:sugar phosphate isomerase/epimerase family protein [Paenibacillus psychroresistens]QGQ98244.1 sugar phosphate isomerase/epimerase [Paenibacillus psychroresistens]